MWCMLLAKMKYTTILLLMYMTGVVKIRPVQAQTTLAVDPCGSYRSFTDIRKRLPTNERSLGDDTYISDAFIDEGWYGDDGIEIPWGTSPEINHCGTIYPAYLRDKVSKSGNQESRTICIDIGFDTCGIEFNIQTKYCGNFSVYYLLRLSLVASGYCAGPTAPVHDYPAYTAPVSIETTLENNGFLKGFVFKCNFQQAVDLLWYTVYWFVNDVLIYTTPAVEQSENIQEQTRLDEQALNDSGTEHIGFKIKCSFRASYHSDSTLGLPTYSDNKFIGIEILTPTVDVKMGESINIQLKATAPIGCNVFEPDCKLTALVKTPDPDDQCGVTLQFSQCGIELDGTDMAATGAMSIRAKFSTNYGSGITLALIRLQTIGIFIPHPMWQNHFIGEVNVRIRQETSVIQGKSCYAVCDPHMKTFQNTHYELSNSAGIFTLYRNTYYVQEVQIQTEFCINDRAYCVCGMVVRVGRIAYTMNHCGSRTSWAIGYSLCDEAKGLLTVEVFGATYKIYFATGTRVEATIHQQHGYSKFMNVYIYPSTLDEDTSDGLCGTLGRTYLYKEDGTSTSDIEAFTTSWRSENRNLFDDDVLQNVNSSNALVYLCICHIGESGQINNEIDCTPSTTNCRFNRNYKQARSCTLNSRTKRSVSKHLTDRNPLPENLPQTKTHKIVKRETWLNGWTEDKAREYCLNLFNKSAAVQICQDIPDVDVDTQLYNCILDIQLMGDTSFSSVAVETIKNKCYHEVSANLTLQNQTEPGQPSIFDQVMAVACPNECSNHGRCENGSCICEENFSGVDCVVDSRDKPLVEHLGNDGACDSANDDCSEISVFGGTFVETENGACKIVSSEMNENGEVENVDETVNEPYIESIGEAICSLPETRKRRDVSTIPGMGIVYIYNVSVSNNGIDYSDSNVMVVFNSVCQYCIINGLDVQCSYTDDLCMSGTDCYENDEPLIGNECYICSVNETSRSWIYSTASKCKPKTTERTIEHHATDGENEHLLIVGVVIGSVALVVIAVFGLFYFIKRKRFASTRALYVVSPRRQANSRNVEYSK